MRTLLPRQRPKIKQELIVGKKRLVTTAFILMLLTSQVTGIQFVNLVGADATTFSDISLGTILPDSNTKPPLVSVFAPENFTIIPKNVISLSINVSIGESSTACSKYIDEVYYKTDWQINNIYIYESDPTKNVYSTEPAQFSKMLNLTEIPEGKHSLVVYAKERGAYHSYSDYSPPIWYFYYYLLEIDGSSTIFFTVDTTAPRIEVLSLEKQTYFTSSVPLNFTVNELTTQIKYSLNGQEKVTIAGNKTLTNLPFGDHDIRILATDEAGNTGASETIAFVLAVPFLTTLVIASVIIVVVAGTGLLQEMQTLGCNFF